MISRFFNYFERIRNAHRLNILATLYMNIRTLPLRQALKFPIYIYGPARFSQLAGKVEFETESIKRGMVKFGRHDDFFTHMYPTLIHLSKNAKIVFKGYASFSVGNIIRVDKLGVLIFGNLYQSGNQVSIDCCKSIEFGTLCGISYKTLISDSSHHYSIDLDTKKINNCDGKIFLAERTFVGNNCFVFKGCKTSVGSLICSSTFAFCNYSKIKGAVIMGNPGEVVDCNYSRIMSFVREKEVLEYFMKNPQKLCLRWEGVFSDPFEDIVSFYK